MIEVMMILKGPSDALEDEHLVCRRHGTLQQAHPPCSSLCPAHPRPRILADGPEVGVPIQQKQRERNFS
jgi:hypothetical protein